VGVFGIIAEFFLSSLQMKVYLDKSDGMKGKKPFDYTKWQRNLYGNVSVRDLYSQIKVSED
jgi:hypothetical protein